MEQLNYSLLFRWFVGLDIDDAVSERILFSANTADAWFGSLYPFK